MFNLDFLLPGHYKLETSENFSSYLEGMGVESKIGKKAAEIAPVRYRFKEKDGDFQMNIFSNILPLIFDWEKK